MINCIISGISEAIFTEFGPTYDIYKESVKQGLNTPCFLITCISPSYDLFRGTRYLRRNQMAIQYFASSLIAKSECMSVAERLYECLELITVDSELVRGAGMKVTESDGVLLFVVNYDFFVHKSTGDEVTMESVESTTTQKG